MISRFNDWLDDRGSLILGLALIIVYGFVAYGAVTNTGTDSRQDDENAASYAAELHICGALSVLSGIVHSNTSNIVSENSGTAIGEQFKDNLDALDAVEYVDPSTGELDCRALVSGATTRG